MAATRATARVRHPGTIATPQVRVHVPPAQRKKSVLLTRKTALRAKECQDWCALHGYHAWHEQHMTPSYNWMFDIPIPAGKLFVVELVTAQILVPAGESARLRMYTSLGPSPSNLDLFLTPQGVANGNAIYVATHALRAYSDGPVGFDVNRDNAVTEGDAFVCMSGHLVTP